MGIRTRFEFIHDKRRYNTYSAQRGAVLQIDVGDYYRQGRRARLLLHGKDGKEIEAPRHRTLETYPDEHIKAAGIADNENGALFRTTGASMAPRLGSYEKVGI